MGMLLIAFVRADLQHFVGDIHSSVLGTGIMNMLVCDFACASCVGVCCVCCVCVCVRVWCVCLCVGRSFFFLSF